MNPKILISGLLFLGIASLGADPLRLPTSNQALFEPGNEEKFLAPTPGKTWERGSFGCVRNDGWHMHEGLDIRAMTHDKKGEPTDTVGATADGTVAYVNRKSGLSNYGNYIVIRHNFQGLELYSLYAHLKEVKSELKPGSPVHAGDPIGIMGRTTNTKEKIAKDRAHVHFEFDFVANERFSSWYAKTEPGQTNDHGDWNGQNLLGLDPRLILLAQKKEGADFSLLRWIMAEPELCKVLVRQPNFPFLKKYAALTRKNPLAEKAPVVGYEISLDYNGVPIGFTPRTAAEVKGSSKYQLISVNEAEYKKNPCRRLVQPRKGQWELAPHGIQLLDLLTF
ncbi:MAG: Peptidase [Verrucomicrobiales bacterium]|nr:Peptidase [Verrucomicrobiales bacterium]